MGFNLGLSSESETKADYAGASDQAALLYKSQGAQMGQTNIGKGATVKTGGIDLSKASVGKGGTLSLTFGDTKPLEDLSKEFSLTVKDINSENTSALSGALEASNKALQSTGGQIGEALSGLSDQLKSAFSQIAKLGESNQTGGDSGRNRIILYVVLAVLGLVGAIFYLRR